MQIFILLGSCDKKKYIAHLWSGKSDMEYTSLHSEPVAETTRN